jgi:hypothetical protein
MNKVKKLLVLLLVAAVVSLSLTGCKSETEPPAEEPPTEETSTGEHPSGEHPE